MHFAPFHFTRRMRHWTLLLTLVVMTWATLTPAIARVLAVTGSDALPWGFICTTASNSAAGGTVNLGNTPSPGDTAMHAQDHCPMCGRLGDVLAPPPAASALPATCAMAQPMPLAFFHAPRLLPAWRTAQPRAPPYI